ncbi:hypothetical protein ONV78_31255 [Hahella sp. CR1]|uniref:endonuclease/exonuclease/phosphatase family protein n=1 Tax=Hahella sp. CR1 TaxID=2992807 RepID=UPI0024433F29|nr:endonuclease/exonuclease/phosphatase family protein [Hahella sp. CR1]MDG9672251.1 hypothetical protein [Hahella sp. CR1]
MTDINVLTWNLQGFKGGEIGSKIRWLLKEKNIHIACLQEVTSMGGWGNKNNAKTIIPFGDYDMYWVPWTGPKNGNARCSMAVLWHREWVAQLNIKYVDSIVASSRGIIFGNFSVGRNKFNLANYHGFGEGRIVEVIGHMRVNSCQVLRWMIFGDFNFEGKIAEDGVREVEEVQVLRSGQVTRPASGKELDYGFGSRQGVAKNSAVALDNGGLSDHLPVIASISLGPTLFGH